MIYTLDTIPLSRFIDVFLGDIDKAVDGEHTEAEKAEAAVKMSEEYLNIVSGKSVTAQMARRNEHLKIMMRMQSVRACRLLLQLGASDDACKVIELLGYKASGDKDAIFGKLDSIEAMDKYRILKIENSSAKQSGQGMTRDYFTKERVAVMSHLKMYIDTEKTKAKEYAFFVKLVCDEIDATLKAYKKK